MEETQTEPVAPESNAAQDDADFEKGFSGAREQPAEVKPEEEEAKTEAAAEPPKVEEVTEAPVVEVPPWKAEFDSVREKLETRLRNAEGHIGNLTSRLKTAAEAAKAQAAAVTSAGGDAPSKAQIEQAVLSPEKLKALEEDYPDIAEPIKQLQAALSATRAELAKRPQFDGESIKTEITGSFAQQIEEAKAEARASRNLALVDLKHPGWEETVGSPEFTAWFVTQPPEIRALKDSAKGSDANRVLDMFEEHSKKAKAAAEKAEANKQRLDRAKTPNGVQVAAASSALSDEQAFDLGFKSAG